LHISDIAVYVYIFGWVYFDLQKRANNLPLRSPTLKGDQGQLIATHQWYTGDPAQQANQEGHKNQVMIYCKKINWFSFTSK
jgi:hypothetical protein